MGMVMCKHMNEQKDRGSSVHDNPPDRILNMFLIHGYGRPNWQEESLKYEII